MKKLLILSLASGNAHKAQELSELLDPSILQIIPVPYPIKVEENSGSFQGNALLKASAYYQALKMPVLSDDSGLLVDALPDELGVESANFGGENLSDRQRAELLLEKMKEIKVPQRNASFVCHLCFYLSPQEIYFFEGRLRGQIDFEYRSGGGFGYDPVFIPDKGEKLKNLSEQCEWKKSYSHRSVAARAANIFFLKGFANFRNII